MVRGKFEKVRKATTKHGNFEDICVVEARLSASEGVEERCLEVGSHT